MLAARATRVINAEDLITNDFEHHGRHSLFSMVKGEQEEEELEQTHDAQDSQKETKKTPDCRKSTQDACNNGKTKIGVAITISMLATILLSVVLIILDSLNYQYCDNPCPVQLTNKTYAEEWPFARQREFIQAKIEESLRPNVDSLNVEPSGTAFFVVNYPDIGASTCEAPRDTYCTYMRESGIFSYSQLYGLELFCTIIFTVEFFVRLVVAQTYFPKCTAAAEKKARIARHRRGDTEGPFFTQMFTYLDFLAILPFYVDVILATTANTDGSVTNEQPNFLVFLDIFRLFRIFRVLKVIRLYERAVIMFDTIYRAITPLLLCIGLLVLIFTSGGSIVLFLEPCNGLPETNECQFDDILQAGYYTWVTILTVGYGDQVPQQISSRIVGMVLMITGTIFLAMPLTILGTYYDTAYILYEARLKMEENKLKSKDKSEVHVETVTLPMSERKGRLLANGMMAFAYILEAEKCLQLGRPIMEDEEEMDCEELPPGHEHPVDLDKLLSSLHVFHYNISKDLAALYPMLKRHMPPKPEERVKKDVTMHPNDAEETGEGEGASRGKSDRKAKSCCGPKPSSRVQPDGAELPPQDDDEFWRRKALRSDASCRDKLWLWLEHPDTSRSSKIGSYVRTFVLLLSFLVTMCSAFPEFQLSYGPAAPSCERAARDYCNILHDLPSTWEWPGEKPITLDWSHRWDGLTKEDVIRANPYCFNMTCGLLNTAPAAQATARGAYREPAVSEQSKQFCRDNDYDPDEMVYSGCVGDTNGECAWPVMQSKFSSINFECPSVSSTSTSTTTIETIVNGKLVITEHTVETKTMTGPEPFDTSTLGQQIQFNKLIPLFNLAVPVCNRKVCQDLDAEGISWGLPFGRPFGFNKFLFIITTFLVIFFAIEFAVNLIAMRSPRRFFKSPLNWAELICVFISVYELIFVTWNFTTGMAGSSEAGDGSSWGYESFGSPSFRRGLGFYFPSDNFRMWALIVPLRFILQIRNISTVKVIQTTFGTAISKLLVPILAMVLIVVVFSALLFLAETSFPCTVGKVHSNKYDSGAVTYRYVPTYPNTYYGPGPHDETSPNECAMQSFLDAIWLGFVTMTGVGYGDYLPRTYLGKVIALSLGIVGAFYMAMPLTIVGSTFYREWKKETETAQRKKMRLKFRSFVGKLISHNKFNPKRQVYTRGMHVEVSTASGDWKEAVVINVHSAAQGKYDVQYGDTTTEKYVSCKLIRPLDRDHGAVGRKGTAQSNLEVFRQHMELLPPEQHEFVAGTFMGFKACHQELMRCLGNIYEEEKHRTGLPHV